MCGVKGLRLETYHIKRNGIWNVTAYVKDSCGWRPLIKAGDEFYMQCGGVQEAKQCLSQCGSYSNISAGIIYDVIRGRGTKCMWHKLFGTPMNVPRHPSAKVSINV